MSFVIIIIIIIIIIKLRAVAASPFRRRDDDVKHFLRQHHQVAFVVLDVLPHLNTTYCITSYTCVVEISGGLSLTTSCDPPLTKLASECLYWLA